jgi:NADH:ubiquinone oxidoreductase subunit C
LRPIIKEIRLKKAVGYVKTVPRQSIGILNYLKDHTLTNFRQLVDIVIYDVPGKTFRFSCLYLLLSFLQNARFILHIKTNEVYPIPSVISLYKSANWLERES